MALFGLFKKREAGFSLVIDIGSHAIKALMSRGSNDLVPRVLKKMAVRLRVPFSFQEAFEHLHEILFAMVQEAGKVPLRVVVGLGPELAHISSAFWRIPRTGRGKHIRREELLGYFSNLCRQQGSPRQEGIIYPLRLFANGYPVEGEALLCHDASRVVELGFQVLALTYGSAQAEALRKLRQMWGGLPIEYVPLAIASQEAIASLGMEEALFVDIGGGFTTLLLIKEKTIAELAAFPMGAHDFVRGIAHIARIPWREAEDLKRQYAQGVVNEATKRRLQEFLTESAEVWEHLFLEALESFYKVGPLPEGVVLGGGGAYLPEIQSVLRKSDWLGKFSSYAVPKMQFMEGWRLFGGRSLEGHIQGPEDAGLASLMVYACTHRSVW